MNELLAILKRNGIDFTLDGDNLSVGVSIDLCGTGITALPDNLSVGGYLYLYGTGITALPDNLSVDGSLYLDAKRISNIAYRENCGFSGRTIFAVWINETSKSQQVASSIRLISSSKRLMKNITVHQQKPTNRPVAIALMSWRLS